MGQVFRPAGLLSCGLFFFARNLQLLRQMNFDQLRSSLSFLSASSRQELASVRRISFSTSAVLPSRRACGSWQFVRRAKGLSVVRCQFTPPVFWQCAAIVLEHLGAPTFSKFGRSEEVDSICIFELYRREENECSTGERLLNSSMTIMTFFVFFARVLCLPASPRDDAAREVRQNSRFRSHSAFAGLLQRSAPAFTPQGCASSLQETAL